MTSTFTRHAPLRGGPGTLVGRDEELEVLREAVTGRRSSCYVVLLHGEAGIGKTALLRAALAECTERLIHVCADPSAGRHSFGLIADLLPTRLAVPAERGLALGDELVEAVTALCAQAPLVVAIDDLHWADDDSLALLLRLTRRLQGAPLTIVATTRPHLERPELTRLTADLARRCVLTEVTLGPLSDDAVRLLARDVVGPRPAPDVMRRLATAGGNPLYLRHILDSLDADADGSGAGDDVMPVLPHLGELDDLPEEARQLLTLAALLGRRFAVRDLAVITGCPVTDLLPPVRQALRAGILGEMAEGTLGFRHDVVRNTLYGALPTVVRGELHRELAKALEGAGSGPAVVGPQVTRAALSHTDAEWVARVAQRATDEGLALAVELWRTVGRFVPAQDRRRQTALTQEAVALQAVGRLSDAERVAAAAVAEAEPGHAADAARCHVEALIGRAALTAARDAAVGHAGSALLFPHERAEQWSLAAEAALLAGDLSAYETLVRVAEAESRRSGSPRTGLRLRVLHARRMHRSGEWEAAAGALGDASRAVDDPTGRDAADCVVGLAAVLGDLDRHAEAQRVVDEAGAALAGRGSLTARRALVRVAANLALDAGQIARATPLLADTLRDEEVNRLHRAEQLARRTVVALLVEGATSAARWLTSVTEADDGADARPGAAWVARADALVREAHDDELGALSALWQGWSATRETELSPDRVLIGAELAILAARQGHSRKVDAVAGALSRLWELNPGVTTVRAAALTARALVAEDDDALLLALHQWTLSPRRLQAAWVVEHAVRRLSSARRRDAGDLVRWAAAAYDDAGARQGAVRMRAVLRGWGVRARRDPARPATGRDALTPAERVVAAFVEQGRSNGEIAEQLTLSRRTVESHVSHILAKLGLRSRSELIIDAAQKGRLADQGERSPTLP